MGQVIRENDDVPSVKDQTSIRHSLCLDLNPGAKICALMRYQFKHDNTQININKEGVNIGNNSVFPFLDSSLCYQTFKLFLVYTYRLYFIV